MLKQLMPKNLVIWLMVDHKNLRVMARLTAKSAQKTIIWPSTFCLKSRPIIKMVPMMEGMISEWKYSRRIYMNGKSYLGY